MTHTFISLAWERIDNVDPETNEVTSYLWAIPHMLETDQGSYSSSYIAEAAQLPAEPTQADVETLILSLYGIEG